MDLLEVPIVDVSINLCGRDRGMAEKCLYRSDVGSFFDQTCSEAMSERMWRNFFIYSYEFCIFSDKIFDSISAEMVTEAVR